MKKKKIKSAICLIVISFLSGQTAMGNEVILKELEKAALKDDPKFVSFNTAAGEKFFRSERVHSNGEKISCTTCHTTDPKKTGLTRAHKVLQPMATILNPERFTDMIKVQKWFKRNCNDVLERTCTAEEKGNFVKYMMSIK